MIELADLIQQTPLDTAAIRACPELERYRYILGAQIENSMTAAIAALCDEIDAMRKTHALQVESSNAHIARLQNEIVAARADGLAIATLMDMTGARNRDDLVRVVGQMMRRTGGGASNP